MQTKEGPGRYGRALLTYIIPPHPPQGEIKPLWITDFGLSAGSACFNGLSEKNQPRFIYNKANLGYSLLLWLYTFLRRRTDWGVTSRYSSSDITSSPRSIVSV